MDTDMITTAVKKEIVIKVIKIGIVTISRNHTYNIAYFITAKSVFLDPSAQWAKSNKKYMSIKKWKTGHTKIQK